VFVWRALRARVTLEMTLATDVAESAPTTTGRRRFLARIVNSIQAVLAGTVGVVLGGAVVSPGLAKRDEQWLPAGPVNALVPNQPTPVMLRIARQDGYAQVVERKTVFLVRTADSQVTALDSTCTHLGCRVSWDAEADLLVCPCHGGRYDRTGQVMAGPPPAPLTSLETQVTDGTVRVRV
jgi:Rieske Fe-S protein